MTEANFTAQPTRSKPAKPYPDYPLYAHASGQWAKKIRGRFHYFGRWADPDGALAKYLEQKDDLHAGRTPRADPDALTVKDAVNAYLNHKQALLEAGELSPRTWAGYKDGCDLLVVHFGKARLISDLGPDDFAALRKQLAKRWGPYRLGDTIQIVRSVFKYALEAGLIDRPMRFGPGFKKPSKKTLRLHRANQGPRMFEAHEVRAMVQGTLVVGKDGPELAQQAGVPLKAMILLGINFGFGNGDCGKLPLSALDLKTGWIDFPRPKTGIPRRCPLWPETVEALKEALAERPEPKEKADAGLVFITKHGGNWSKAGTSDALTHEMRKLMGKFGINGHRNFYTLRHSFRTVADESKDQPAVDFIMGHARDDMASVYRERISDARLKAVTDHVRQWLFGSVQ